MCVVPKYDGPLTYSKRTSLGMDPKIGAEYYVYLPEPVAAGKL